MMSNSGEMIALSIFLILMILLGLIGNLLILSAIFRLVKHNQSDISYIILANIAFSDCLSSLTVMPYNLASNIDPDISKNNHFLCQAGGLLTYPFFIISQTSLLLFTVEKYISIAYPFQYYSIVTRTRVIIMVSLTWIIAISFIIPISVLKWIKYGMNSGICGVVWSGKAKLLYLLLTAVICFGLPFLIEIVLHVHIFITAKRHVIRIHCLEEVANSEVGLTEYGSNSQIHNRKTPHRHDGHKKLLKELKAAKMIFILFLEFIICLSPYAVTRILKALDFNIPTVLYKFSAWMWYMTAVCNPVVYLAFQKEIRKCMKSMLPCFKH